MKCCWQLQVKQALVLLVSTRAHKYEIFSEKHDQSGSGTGAAYGLAETALSELSVLHRQKPNYFSHISAHG